VAFVLGGGGVLGAVEVGMLRALLEYGIVPDLIVGTSIGAVNGVLVAADPSPAVTERLAALWSSPEARAVYGDSPPRQLARIARGRTRPGGVLAALEAAPDADVMLVAHTGVDHLLTVADVWRELPMDKRITMQWWLEPASAVPDTPDERVDWLYSWWARIDAWIAENRPVELPWQPLARR
jgi:hypothetical protein